MIINLSSFFLRLRKNWSWNLEWEKVFINPLFWLFYRLFGCSISRSFPFPLEGEAFNFSLLCTRCGSCVKISQDWKRWYPNSTGRPCTWGHWWVSEADLSSSSTSKVKLLLGSCLFQRASRLSAYAQIHLTLRNWPYLLPIFITDWYPHILVCAT
jgi:hypothetical protein